MAAKYRSIAPDFLALACTSVRGSGVLGAGSHCLAGPTPRSRIWGGAWHAGKPTVRPGPTGLVATGFFSPGRVPGPGRIMFPRHERPTSPWDRWLDLAEDRHALSYNASFLTIPTLNFCSPGNRTIQLTSVQLSDPGGAVPSIFALMRTGATPVDLSSSRCRSRAMWRIGRTTSEELDRIRSPKASTKQYCC